MHDEVQLQLPVSYEKLNLCDMHKKGNMKTLSIAIPKNVCKYFGVSAEGFHARLKAEYLSALSELVKECDCCPVYDLFILSNVLALLVLLEDKCDVPKTGA